MNIDMKKYIVLLATAIIGLTACDDILDRFPKDKMTPETYFKSETELQLFTNSLYNNLLPKEPYNEQSDHYIKTTPSDVIKGGSNRIVPRSGSGWSWGDLRKLNLALAYMETNCEDQVAKDQYAAVCRFFRAYIYFDKVKRFGDVPWIDHEIQSDDSLTLYAPRDSRELVMQNMIKDVDFACEHLPSAYPTGLHFRVTKWAAYALKAQFCLFEGTFRKYHPDYATLNKGNWDTSDWKDWKWYLEQSAEAANVIMTQSPHKLYTTGHPELDYAVLFSEYEANNDEFILAINFDNSLEQWHNATAMALMNSQGRISMTRKLACSYLMKDGTRFTDKQGWETMQFSDEVKDRDPRMAQTIRIPKHYRLVEKSKVYSYSQNALGVDPGITLTGYHTAKWLMPEGNASNDKFDRSYNDMPVYRLAEVYLNYAEAKAELGTLTQADLDMSINKIRKRVGMPDMDMAQANANPDPFLSSEKWGYTNVSGANKGVILEIRRERAVELAQESFRYTDLIRWKCGKCLEQPIYGVYFPGKGPFDLDGDGKMDVVFYSSSDIAPDKNTATYIFKLGTDINLSEGEKGYVEPYKAFTDIGDIKFDESRDYFYPIPIDDRSLNHKLVQNPGWNDGLSF